MASYVKNRKASAALESLAARVPAAAAASPPVTRSAAMVVSNALLLSAAAAWGRAALEAPARLDPSVAAEAVCLLVDGHARLAAVAQTLDGRSESDPVVAAHRWETLANEVVTLTLGAAVHPGSYPAAVTAWRSLWQARRAGPEAVHAMLAYARAYSVAPVPPVGGRPFPVTRLPALASTLPPMFRPAAAKRA